MRLFFLFFSVSIFAYSASVAQTDNIGSGRAIRFDGLDDYVNLGNIYDGLTLPITVSAWVYLENPQGYLNPIFISQDNEDIYNGFWFTVSTTAVDMQVGDGAGHDSPLYRRGKTANVSIDLNQWYHICGVMRSPTDIDLYVNGINVGGNISGNSTLPMNSNFPLDEAKIGRYYTNSATYFFKGAIDDVQVYNIPLTQTQVQQNMCKKLTGAITGLIGFWDFNETTGTIATDKSPNGYTGTLMNGATRIYSGAPIGDESIFLYPASWNTTTLTMSEAEHQVSVSGVSVNTAGAHIYTIRSLPSRTTGIDLGSASSTYFGVFIADIRTGRTFDLDYGQSCELVFREDNSKMPWVEGETENILNRSEFIRQAALTETNPIDLGPDEELCPFTARILKPVDDPQGYTFLWQDGSTNATFNASSYGTYWVNVRKGCFFDRDTINFIREERQFSIELGEDQAVCPLEPFVLQPLSNPTGYTFTWSNGSLQSTLLVEEYGKYWVSVEHECGTASDTIRFSRPDFEEIKIPNIITPNNDNLNDLFEVGEDLQGATLEIFNRWGKKVYHNSSYQNTWNAENLPTGVYYYILHSACIEDKKGWLSVTR